MRHQVFRTVRNGQVLIDRRRYQVDDPHRPYKGELDGQRFLFGRYWAGTHFEPYVSLWGTEALARIDDPNSDEWDKEHAKEPNIINGCIYWAWWRLMPLP